MADQLINEFIDIPALQAQVQKTNTLLQSVQATIVSTNNAIGGTKNQSTFSGVAASADDLNNKVKELTTTLNTYKKTADNTTKQAAAMQREQKIVDDLRNDYKQLDLALRDLKISYFNHAINVGESAESTLNLKKQVNDLSGYLKRLDASIGDNRRNVGNYKSAFDGLGMSFSQVARELPSLSISIQQFVLAISNNLPMVIDELGKTRAELKALRDAGEAAPSFFTKLTQSFLSFQVITSVIIGLFTIFSKQIIEFFASLTGSTEKMDKLNAELYEFKKQSEEATRQIEDFAKQLDYLIKLSSIQFNITAGRGLAQDLINASSASVGFMTKLRQLREQETEAFERVREVNKLVLDGLKGSSTGALNPFGGRGDNGDKGIYEQYGGDIEKILDLAGDKLTSDGKKLLETQKKYKDDLAKIQEQIVQTERDGAIAAAQVRQAEKDVQLESIRDQLESQKISLNQAIKYNQAWADLEGYNLKDRINAQKTASAERIQLIQTELAQALAVDNLSEQQRLNLQKQANIDIQNEVKANLDAIAKINQQFAIQRFNELQEWVKFSRDAEEKINQQQRDRVANEKKIDEDVKAAANTLRADELSAIEKFYTDAAKIREGNFLNQKTALLKQYQDGKISYQQYLTDLEKLTKGYAQTSLEDQLAALEKQIALVPAGTSKWADLYKQIAQVKNQLQGINKLTFADFVARFEKASALVTNLSQTIQTLGSIGYEQTKQKLDDEAAAIENNRQLELQRIQDSTLSEQQKTEQTIQLNAQADAQKQQIEVRQKKAAQEQARFQRMADIGNIVTTTALAVVRTLADNTIPTAFLRIALAGTIGALGAAQLAKAIATPIPAYEHGTDFVPNTGIARVSEKGTELVVEPSGRVWLTPERESLVQLNRGSKVIPHHKLDQIQNAMLLRGATLFQNKQDNRPDMKEEYLRRIAKNSGKQIKFPKQKNFSPKEMAYYYGFYK